MRRVAMWLVPVVLLLPAVRSAESGWQTFDRSSGLSGDRVTAMCESHDGSLWFGTLGAGVCRYDGAVWDTLTKTKICLASDNIAAVLEDRNHALWIGTDRGLSRLEGAGCTRYSWVNGLADSTVQCLLEDRTGRLWCGTSRGAYVFDGERFMPVAPLASTDVRAMLEDVDEALWFGTNRGAFRYDGTAWTAFTSDSGLADNLVQAIQQDRGGAMWFGGPKGATRHDGSTGSWQIVTTDSGLGANDVECMMVDSMGAVWFGSQLDTVSRYDGFEWKIFTRADGLAGPFISSMLQDRDGALWFGTAAGASRFDGESWKTESTAEGKTDIDIVTILEDRQGALWVGALSGEVYRQDGEALKPFVTPGGPASYPVLSILQDRAGAMWFGSYGGGVFRCDTTACAHFTAATPGLLDDRVRAMLEDRAGTLWIATDAGVCLYDGSTWTTVAEPELTTHIVSRILQDQRNGMWFGTLGGGAILHDGASWERFTTTSGLAGNAILSMLEDRDGALWFGTADSAYLAQGTGVSRHDRSSWQTFTLADGLVSNRVASILQDSRAAMWFATDRGVSRLAAGEWGTYRTEEHFASGRVASAIEGRSGVLWFGTSKGLVRHDPDRVAPRVVITASPPAVWPTRRVTVGYVAGFREQSDARFSHALGGDDWSPWSSMNTWSRDDLTDGEYTLRIRARDQIGNVSRSPASYRFAVDATPPSALVSAPVTGQAVRDSIAILGTAADPRFGEYLLEVRPQGQADYSLLVRSRLPVAEGVLGGWNTRANPDGSYELRLTVLDTLGLRGVAIAQVVVDNEPPSADQTAPAVIHAAEGGSLFSADGDIHVYFPPHAVAEDVTVRIDPDSGLSGPAAMGPGVSQIVRRFSLSWDGGQLAKPAVMDVLVPGSPAGQRYALWDSLPGEPWQRLGGTADEETGRLTCTVRRAAAFAAVVEDGPAGKVTALPGLSLTPRVFSPLGGFASREVAIGFTLAQPAAATITVHNRAGRLVREVAHELHLQAGENVVRWDGRDQDGNVVAGGLYIVTVDVSQDRLKGTLAVVR